MSYTRTEKTVSTVTYIVPGPAFGDEVLAALDAARSENRRLHNGDPGVDKAIMVSVKGDDIVVSFTATLKTWRSEPVGIPAYDGSSNPLDFDDGEVVEDSDRQYWMRVQRDDDSGWSTFGDDRVYPLNAPRFPVKLVT